MTRLSLLGITALLVAAQLQQFGVAASDRARVLKAANQYLAVNREGQPDAEFEGRPVAGQRDEHVGRVHAEHL
jgi:hypothetical protein